MTQHNIAGSEAFQSGPRVIVSFAGRRRRKPLHPAVWLHLATIPLGIALAAADIAIGKPYCVAAAVCVLVAWRLWPSR